MGQRIRTMYGAPISGSFWNYGNEYINTVTLTQDRCVDVVAPGDGHPLTIEHHKILTSTLGDGVSAEDPNRVFVNYPLAGFTNGNPLNHLDIPGIPSNGELAAELVAKTNPSRPVVDIPIYILELRDLPGLVQRAGRTLLQRISRDNLKYHFAIAPLVNDLKTMLTFHDAVEKRFVEMRKLRESGIRRKFILFRGSASEPNDGNFTANSSPGSAGCVYSRGRTTKLDIYGFIKWFPQGEFPESDKELRRAAWRAVYGLTLDGSTAWESIPFSWLIDWFTNVGDLISATRNFVPVSHSVPSIMPQWTTVGTYDKIWDENQVFPDTVITESVTKSRYPASATLSAHMPYLGVKQMSILGSLAVLRSGKYL